MQTQKIFLTSNTIFLFKNKTLYFNNIQSNVDTLEEYKLKCTPLDISISKNQILYIDHRNNLYIGKLKKPLPFKPKRIYTHNETILIQTESNVYQTKLNDNTFTEININPDDISITDTHILFQVKDKVFGMGRNNNGQLLLQDIASINTPKLLPINNIKKIEANSQYSCFLTTDNKLYKCGYAMFDTNRELTLLEENVINFYTSINSILIQKQDKILLLTKEEKKETKLTPPLKAKLNYNNILLLYEDRLEYVGLNNKTIKIGTIN